MMPRTTNLYRSHGSTSPPSAWRRAVRAITRLVRWTFVPESPTPTATTAGADQADANAPTRALAARTDRSDAVYGAPPAGDGDDTRDVPLEYASPAPVESKPTVGGRVIFYDGDRYRDGQVDGAWLEADGDAVGTLEEAR